MSGPTRPSSRADRRAANRDVLRRANARVPASAISRIANRFLDLHCECTAPDCHATISVHARAYAPLADDRHTWVVAPGHADEESERVAAAFPRYHRVETDPHPVSDLNGALRPDERRPHPDRQQKDGSVELHALDRAENG